MQTTQPFRPSQHAEYTLVTSILDGLYPPGSALPNERALAKLIGVTRPTLRETLQRLANEGWIEIRHGKTTLVNNYWEKGGLSLLSTFAKYGEHVPNGFITQLLEVRAALLPVIARRAAMNAPEPLLNHLVLAQNLADHAQAFANYDWELQVLMAKHSNNSIFLLIFNDFDSIFGTMALRYFKWKSARESSLTFYRELKCAFDQGPAQIEIVVRSAMEKSIELWERIKLM